MKTLMSSDHYPDIRFGFKLSNNNIGHENGMLFPGSVFALIPAALVGWIITLIV